MDRKLPEVCLIRDLAPDDPATRGTLSYRNLAATALRLERADSTFLENAWQAKQGSLEERIAAEAAAGAYLTRIASQAVTANTPAQHDLWAERFNRASIEIFGEPDPEEAKQIIQTRHQELLKYQAYPQVDQHALDYLLEFYGSVAGEPGNKELASTDRSLWPEIASFMKDRFGPLFDVIDGTCAGKERLTPMDRKTIAIAALKWLSENHHDNWARWKVIEKNDATFSTFQENEEIAVGMLAAPVPPASAKNILTHELLHALRSLNGRNVQDKYLALGLPGRDTFEEGWATLFGWAISGDSNAGPRLLYRNIALALGSIDGNPVHRSKLLRLSYCGSKIDRQARGIKSPLPLETRRSNFIHVSRMYRGGRGDNFGAISAVFTKDVVYHRGYKSAERYIQGKLDAGKSMSEVFDYLVLGGFDPEDEQHAKYVEDVTGKRL